MEQQPAQREMQPSVTPWLTRDSPVPALFCCQTRPQHESLLGPQLAQLRKADPSSASCSDTVILCLVLLYHWPQTSCTVSINNIGHRREAADKISHKSSNSYRNWLKELTPVRTKKHNPAFPIAHDECFSGENDDSQNQELTLVWNKHSRTHTDVSPCNLPEREITQST